MEKRSEVRDISSAGYPPGAFFKGCEIIYETFKGSEKRTEIYEV